MPESTKVNKLNELKGTYTGAKNNYTDALDKYNEALKQLNLNNKSPYANNDISGDEVTTKDKVKMKTTTAFATDYLDDTTDEFQSSLTYSGATTGTIYSNQFVQRNLHELTSDVSLNAEFADHTVVGYAINADASFVSSDGLCNERMYNRCDGYAEMTNHNYYGLYQNTNDECECYIFNNLPAKANAKFIDVEVNGNFSVPNQMNYFGIMFDGGLYYLTESNYSDNFNNLYEVDPAKTNLIAVDSGSTDIQDTDRNPFTGSGPNTLDISGLGTFGCGTG